MLQKYKHNLFLRHYIKFVIPSILASTVTTFSIAIDSVFAGTILGSESLGVIALCQPFLYFDEVIHCLFGPAISTIMLNLIGQKKRRDSNHYIATIIVCVAVSYSAFVVISFFIYDPIVRLMTTDAQLIYLSKSYLFPILLFMPLLEICLCLERAFMADGRAKFFSSRAIIVAFLNILLDYFLLKIWGMGLFGLAMATNISSVCGYCVTLSHYFSKKCTIKIDFSGLKNYRKTKKFIKATLIFGSNYVWSELLQLVVSFIITTSISLSGGVESLAIWNCVCILFELINRFQLGINTNTSLFVGYFSGLRDYTASKMIFKLSLKISLVLASTITILVIIFSNGLASIYGFEDNALTLCSNCFKLASICCPILIFNYAILLLLPIVKKNKLSYFLTCIFNVLQAVFISLGTTINIYFVYVGYMIAVVITWCIILYMLRKNRNYFFPINKEDEIYLTFIKLSSSEINDTINEVFNLDKEIIPPHIKRYLCLLIEEWICYLKSINNKIPLLYIRISQSKGCFKVSVVDNGNKHDNIIDNKSYRDIFTIQKCIFEKSPVDSKYDRIIEMNTLLMKLSEQDITGDNCG